MPGETYALSASRLTAVVGAWEAAAAGDATASKCSHLLAIFGELSAQTLENQRGQAIIQYLLQAKKPVTNAAVLLSRTSTLIVHDGELAVTVPEVAGHTVTVVTGAENVRPALQAALSTATASSGSGDGGGGEAAALPVLGAALKEIELQEGDFAQNVVAATVKQATADRLVEAAPLLGSFLFVKDDAALGCVEKAAGLCSAVFRRYARELVKEQVVKSSPATLLALREQLCAKLDHPATISGLETLDESDFAVAAGLTPAIFHRGVYAGGIQVSAEQMEQTMQAPMRGDVVVVRYGVKNNGYTAFIGRTLIFQSQAPAGAAAAYQFLYDVSEKTVALLKPGVALRQVYADVLAFATARNAALAARLSKSFGFITGLLVLESRGTISEKGTATVQNNMSFVVRVVLERVGAAAGNGTSSADSGGDGGAASEASYDLELADTVVVREGAAETKTKVARKPSEALYEDIAAAQEGEPQAESGAFEPQRRDLSKITRQGQSDTVLISREAQRDEELKKLLRELHAEFLAAGGKKETQTAGEEYRYYDLGRLAQGELSVLTPSEANAAAQTASKAIRVQADKKLVWLPICGQLCPFHVSTINKVEVKREGEHYSFVITFHALQEANIAYKLNRTKVFLKELTYTCPRDSFTELQTAIQATQQRIKNDDAARKRNASSASYGKLIIVASPLRLPQVKMRPPIVVGRQNKGCVGNLELHQNGLRFSFIGGAPVDILFENVKHVIFQPAVNAIAVIYHITLKRGIELGRKSTSEIQFVAEVMESSEAVSGAFRSFDDEVRAEEGDLARMRQTNVQFMNFARAVEERSTIRTQLPVNQFSFDGVHSKSMTTFKGSREVLWAVSDWPAFTKSVAEIEVVSFERVIPGGSTFDMSLIPKDYHSGVVTINSIPKSSLEVLKDWCLAARLYYMESTVNPNWKAAMKDIREDAEWDPWLPGAGWSLLNNEPNDEEDEEESDSESDSTYYEEEDEEDTDSDDDSSWLEDDEEDESGSDASKSADDDEESASSDVSWDELERKAEEHDRKHRYSDDEDDERGRHRKRTRTERPAPPAARQTKVPMPNFGKTAIPPPTRRY